MAPLPNQAALGLCRLAYSCSCKCGSLIVKLLLKYGCILLGKDPLQAPHYLWL